MRKTTSSIEKPRRSSATKSTTSSMDNNPITPKSSFSAKKQAQTEREQQRASAASNDVIMKNVRKNYDDTASLKSFHTERSAHVVLKPTTYLETLVHVLKANLGAGCFAMGTAFMNAGLYAAPFGIILVGLVTTWCCHLLLESAGIIAEKLNLPSHPTYEDTVELCFLYGPKHFHQNAITARRTCKAFLLITQMGFCSVYLIIVAETCHTICNHYSIHLHSVLWITIATAVIFPTILIRNLKYLTPVSFGGMVSLIVAIASLCIVCIIRTVNNPEKAEVHGVAPIERWPLFFGTALFTYEGISLVIPLRNEMKNKESFAMPGGVLNVGISIVTSCYILIGLFGYLAFGEDVLGSLSLNLPQSGINIFVQVCVAFGIAMSLPLQFFVPASIIYYDLLEKWPEKYPLAFLDYAVRIPLYITAFVVASLVPKLSLFISLVGSFCSTALCLVFPVLCDITLRTCKPEFKPLKSKYQWLWYTSDAFILVIALLGFTFGTYFAAKDIVLAFKDVTPP